MDFNYKPPSSLDVAKLPSRKPSLRLSMTPNVATTLGHSQPKLQNVLESSRSNTQGEKLENCNNQIAYSSKSTSKFFTSL